MSGGGGGGSSYGGGSPSLAAQLKSAQGGGSEAGMTEPTTSVGPAMQPSAAPTGGGQAALGIPYGMPFLGVPFNQYAGGPQASPFAHLGDQILNARHIMHGGAGRFGANNAARFGFAGGSFWRPDNLNYGPAPQSPYQPQRPLTPPQQFTQPPGQQPSGPPAGPAPTAAGGIDHAANFKKLMAEDPAAAYYYTHQGGAQPWFFQNRNSLFGSQQALDDWTNKYGGGGSIGSTYGGGHLSAAQINKARTMAGLKPIEAWRIGGSQ